MKKFLLSIPLLFLAGEAMACLGAGRISLEYQGEKVGYVDEYEAKLVINSDYTLEFINTKGSDEDDGIDIIDDTGAWVWICDERDGIDNQYRAERPYCSSLEKDTNGAYILDPIYYGMRDFHISISSKKDADVWMVFKVDEANIDPNQPRKRSGGCGRTVEL